MPHEFLSGDSDCPSFKAPTSATWNFTSFQFLDSVHHPFPFSWITRNPTFTLNSLTSRRTLVYREHILHQTNDFPCASATLCTSIKIPCSTICDTDKVPESFGACFLCPQLIHLYPAPKSVQSSNLCSFDYPSLPYTLQCFPFSQDNFTYFSILRFAHDTALQTHSALALIVATAYWSKLWLRPLISRTHAFLPWPTHLHDRAFPYGTSALSSYHDFLSLGDARKRALRLGPNLSSHIIRAIPKY